MSDISFSVKNMSERGRGITVNDNIAGSMIDNTFYESNQAKTLSARANSSGVADIATTPVGGRTERHFPVRPGQVVEVF
jgi:hypothetical protein